MTKQYFRALGYTLQYEGGYVNDPRDRGGATNYGVTQRVYSAWLMNNGNVGKDVRNITTPEVESIYWEQYWLAARCDKMPPLVAIAVFDFAVNSGVRTAIKKLQQVLKVTPDGVVGNVTLHVLMSQNEQAVVSAYLQSRINFFKAICLRNPTQLRFLKGWLNRVRDLSNELGV